MASLPELEALGAAHQGSILPSYVLQLLIELERGPWLEHLKSDFLRDVFGQGGQLVLQFLALKRLLLCLLSVIGQAVLELAVLLLGEVDLLADVLDEGVELRDGFLLPRDLALLRLDLLFQVFLLLEETVLHLLEDLLLRCQVSLQLLLLLALLFEELVVLDALVGDVLVRLVLQVLDLAGPELKVRVRDREVALIADVVLLVVRLAQVLGVLEASGAHCLAAPSTVVPRAIRELPEAAEAQRAVQLLLLSFLELVSLNRLALAWQELPALPGLELGQLSLGAALWKLGGAALGCVVDQAAGPAVDHRHVRFVLRRGETNEGAVGPAAGQARHLRRVYHRLVRHPAELCLLSLEGTQVHHGVTGQVEALRITLLQGVRVPRLQWIIIHFVRDCKLY